jgi:hypothetical protein
MDNKKKRLIFNIIKIREYNNKHTTACLEDWFKIYNFDNKSKLDDPNTLISYINKTYGNDEVFVCFNKLDTDHMALLISRNLNNILGSIIIVNKDYQNANITKSDIKFCKKDSIKFNDNEFFHDVISIENKIFDVYAKIEMLLVNGFNNYRDTTILPFITRENSKLLDKYSDIPFTIIYKFKIGFKNDKLSDEELINLIKIPTIKIKIKTKELNSVSNISDISDDGSISDNDDTLSFKSDDNNDDESYINTVINTCNVQEVKQYNKPNIPILLPNFEIEFINYVKPTEQKYIKYLIHNLYKINKKFNLLVDSYSKLFIIKGIHNDLFNINSAHITGYFKSLMTGNKSLMYHFYILNNTICRMTSLNNDLI